MHMPIARGHSSTLFFDVISIIDFVGDSVGIIRKGAGLGRTNLLYYTMG